MKEEIWACKIGGMVETDLPDDANDIMREAITKAFVEITGRQPSFILSTWDDVLSAADRAEVDRAQEHQQSYKTQVSMLPKTWPADLGKVAYEDLIKGVSSD